MELQVKRVYHPYWLWEDFNNGFYNNEQPSIKESNILKVIELFNSKELTEKWMNYVIDNWKYSCEHNLTNNSLNRIAWIGQSACCCYAKVPCITTMEAWNLLSVKVQERANKIAFEVLNKWEKRNKNIQLCLNFM